MPFVGILIVRPGKSMDNFDRGNERSNEKAKQIQLPGPLSYFSASLVCNGKLLFVFVCPWSCKRFCFSVLLTPLPTLATSRYDDACFCVVVHIILHALMFC